MRFVAITAAGEKRGGAGIKLALDPLRIKLGLFLSDITFASDSDTGTVGNDRHSGFTAKLTSDICIRGGAPGGVYSSEGEEEEVSITTNCCSGRRRRCNSFS